MTPQALYALGLLFLPVVNPADIPKADAQFVVRSENGGVMRVDDVNAWLVANGYPLPGQSLVVVPRERWRVQRPVPLVARPRGVQVMAGPAFAGPRSPGPTPEEMKELRRKQALNRLLNEIDGSPWWRDYVGLPYTTPH